jgi:hypothetical protein
MIRGQILGVEKVAAKLKSLAKEFPDHVAAAIYQEAQIEMTEAKRRTPVDITKDAPHPGQLRASGRVSEPERKGKDITVTLSFGGAAIDYAVHVHENPDAIHPVGQWKYLESVLNESRSFMATRLARRVDFNKMRRT